MRRQRSEPRERLRPPPGRAVLLAEQTLAGDSRGRDNRQLWLLEEGVLRANLPAEQYGREDRDSGAQVPKRHRRLIWTTQPLDADGAAAIAAADEYAMWLPWHSIASFRTRGWFPRWWIQHADGSTIRLAIRQGPHSAAMRLLAGALDTASIRADLNFPDTPRRVWVRRSVAGAFAIFLVTAIVLLALTWNNEADMRQRALDRWSSGEYTAEHPVALIAAEAIVDQRLGWFTGTTTVYDVSHDEVLVTMSGGRSQYGSPPSCWRLARTDAGWLRWDRLGRGPCDREGHTPAGVEGMGAETWLEHSR